MNNSNNTPPESSRELEKFRKLAASAYDQFVICRQHLTDKEAFERSFVQAATFATSERDREIERLKELIAQLAPACDCDSEIPNRLHDQHVAGCATHEWHRITVELQRVKGTKP